MARGTAKANTNGRKGYFNGNGKGHLSEMEIVFLLLVAQLQDSRSHAPTGSSEQWVLVMDLHSLLPRLRAEPTNAGIIRT